MTPSIVPTRDSRSPAADLDAGVRRVAAAVTTATRRGELFDIVRTELGDVTDFVWTGALDVSDWSLTPAGGADPELAALLTDDEVHSAVEQAITDDTVVTVTPEGDWGAHAAAAGYEAASVVPVAHGDSTYGIVLVGAERRTLDAASGILADLGAIVGHARSAVTRRTAMLGGEEVVVEFRERDAAKQIVGADVPPDAEIHFERTIPLAKGSLLQYVTVHGMDPDRFRERVRSYADVSHIRRVNGADGAILFETVYEGPSIVRTLVDHDARVVRSSYENGDHYTVAALPPAADVATVVAEVTNAFPDIEVVSKRTLRDRRSTRELRTTVGERLTARQRTATEAALAAGYFERPRESTGAAVAAALDINQSTFSQHLRAAHRKVYGALFDSPVASDGGAIPEARR